MAAGLHRPTGQLDVTTALVPYAGPWNERAASHLMRRAGFGATPGELHRMLTRSMQQTVDDLIHFPPADASPPGELVDLQTLLAQGPLRGLDADTRRQRLMGFRMEERRSILALQHWWLNRMLVTPAPLQEKMTFLLHGHFTTAAIQKNVTPALIYQQNQLYRDNALGNLRDLTLVVSKDPAMLLYLDNARSSKAHPNENYARELMELFTLGRGNYSEEDVRQSARAFTGWTINRATQQFVQNPRLHDDGVKTFLGRTGNFDGSDIVTVIYQQPACSAFWATTLLNWFVYNDPEPQLVDAVAHLLEKNDYQLAPVLSVLLRSNVFFSERAYRALVKSPAEFVVGTYKAFGMPEIDPSAVRAMAQMGQVLFYPPNVAGWPGGAAWLTSQMMIARQNFVAGLVNSAAMQQSPWLSALPRSAGQAAGVLLQTILQGDVPQQSFAQLASYLDGSAESALGTLSPENFELRVRGGAYLAMAMPAYQLN